MESGDSAVMLDAETLSLARNLGETLTQDYREVPPADFIEALSVLVAAHSGPAISSCPKGRIRATCRPA